MSDTHAHANTYAAHRQAIVSSGLELASAPGWQVFTWQDLADHSGLPIERVWELCPSRSALLVLMLSHIAGCARLDALRDMSASAPPREILTDMLLRGFEALEGHHSGFKDIWKDLGRSHIAASVASAHSISVVQQEIRAMICTAGAGRGDVGDTLCTIALAGLLLKTTINFADQTEPNIDAIMASLDRGTLRIWGMLNRLGFPERGSTDSFIERVRQTA